MLATGDNTNEMTVSEHVLDECVEQIQFLLSSFRKNTFLCVCCLSLTLKPIINGFDQLLLQPPNYCVGINSAD